MCSCIKAAEPGDMNLNPYPCSKPLHQKETLEVPDNNRVTRFIFLEIEVYYISWPVAQCIIDQCHGNRRNLYNLRRGMNIPIAKTTL